MMSTSCRVLRDGKKQRLDSKDLVPGDRVLLTTGNAVPADLRLLSAIDLKTDEAALTGESSPVNKKTEPLPENTDITERLNMAWTGTYVVNGHGEGVAVATGMKTEFGKIAQLTGAIGETQTRLQKQLGLLARQLGIIALMAAIAVVLAGVFSGRDAMSMVMTGISLAVAAVPEGLPAIVTITLALGAGVMARKKALLRRLQAAETLGAVSVICTDKTGTLTKNEMTVQKIWMAGGRFDVSGAGYNPAGEFSENGKSVEAPLHPDLMQLLDTGRTCNHARIEQKDGGWHVAAGSPTEAALVVAAEKAGLKQDPSFSIVHEHSFSSTRKRMSVVEKSGKGLIVHAKGAPESLLPLCTHVLKDGMKIPLDSVAREEIEEAHTAFARDGFRTLALACKPLPEETVRERDIENGLIFLGVTALLDPPRAEVPEALALARKAGIRVIVITGDSPDTARAVLKQTGMPVAAAVTSGDIKKMSDGELSALLRRDILFARTLPEDKFRIVRLLQAENQIVAMTGDGVNDAPALKQADIGIAMGIRGTDVAKGAADIVLTDDNFASIIAAVREGRRQYANIRKCVQFLVAHNIGEVTAIFFNILTGSPLILLPIQILWINLMTDSVTALALSVERAEKNIMEEPPRDTDRPLLDRKAFIILGVPGVYIGLAAIGLFRHYLPQSYALANAAALTFIVLSAQVLVLNFRNLHGPLSAIGWFSNPWLLAAIAAMTGLQAAAVHMPVLQNILHTMPLSAQEWMMVLLAALPLFIGPEIYKVARAR
jgi:Ca2+-transporting ATPase